MTNASIPVETLNFIETALSAAKSITIMTMRKAWKVTPKSNKAWQDAGKPLFVIDKEGNLRFRTGKTLDIIATKAHCLVGLKAE